jgi:hypothetical protein
MGGRERRWMMCGGFGIGWRGKRTGMFGSWRSDRNVLMTNCASGSDCARRKRAGRRHDGANAGCSIAPSRVI